MATRTLLPAVGLVGALALALQGCAGAGLTLFGVGAGVSAGTAVDHTLSGIAYKTFTAPLPEMRAATLRTLDRMAFQLVSDEKAEFGRKIQAKAEEREILIELERLTPQTTRMRVTADQIGGILRDRSTATEIIVQTAYTVDEGQRAAAEK
jgi:hypothetical protein